MIINDVNVNYIDYGNKEGTPIVLLHGWGQNIEMMKGIGDNFQTTNRIIIIDLPGFGKSEEPKYAWSLDEYVLFLEQFLNKLEVSNPIVIGHSFGGKIGLLYSSKNKVSKLVCLASPFKQNIKKDSMKTKLLKTAKKIPVLNKLEGFAKKHIGSTDYKNATPMMRDILVKTVNLDITEDVKKIKCSTIIVWGTNDEAVPLKRAYELESLIDDSAVIEYEGCTHYAYLERLNQTVNILNSFLN